MYDLDAAALAHREANPPPDWWPIPPRHVGRVYQWHPVIGPPTGGKWGADTTSPDPEVAVIIDHKPPPPPPAPEPAPAPAADHEPTAGDILAATYPGDTIPAIAARFGRQRGWLERCRARDEALAIAMDRARGKRTSYSWGER